MNITFKSYLNELCCFLFEILSDEENIRSSTSGSKNGRKNLTGLFLSM